jgi:energy-coupling factor transporter ATP-binding protein EcfA2
MLSVDMAQKATGSIGLDALLAHAVHLDWNPAAERFVWRYPAFEHLPLELCRPLPGERLVPLLKQIGQAAQHAIKVEVPFAVVTPTADLWQQSCDSELRVPVGRAGANRLHYVRLGKGTSQHLLVAGKTGSGKSTFLHALVTSAALHFSPREVEFYLVDFKKGVEFKAYATQGLPHARVIAIESEREFGISVLERLDEVLRERGEKFRTVGVQSLADYRAACTHEAMPRVLLVIDEFQELFVEDDKLAGQASLLLDRLIRQGRAFGMHVVLGSQTLAGAYSLARSTLGQMAVRVALQCSESDAHLILSDERNQAARFLSRPGEAIYNDQNGMATANEPFQVVWLPDAERSQYLARVRDMTQLQKLDAAPPIVFEGNAPSDPAENRALARQMAGDAPAVPTGWLGAAVSIRPPVAVEFHRAAGANLLMVGAGERLALGMLATVALGLASSGDTSVDIVDGSRPGEPGVDTWPAVVAAGGDRVRWHEPRSATGVIAELHDELARRQSAADESAPSRFLLVYNAARIRELRKSDDDFGFSFTKSEAPASAAQQFIDLLKNGPAWGVHVLVWCDNYNSLMRIVERTTLREFVHRVVLQMAAGDSSNLVDTPAAARLSEFRALLYSDETGDCEKFRPYEVPSESWLAALAGSQQVSQ